MGAKRKARSVLCGNFVVDYRDSSTSNLDAAVFRLVVNITVTVCQEEMVLVIAGSSKRLSMVLKLKEAPKIWEVRRDADLKKVSFSCLLDGIKLKPRLWQSRVHKSVWLIISDENFGLIRQRLDALPVRKSSMEAYVGQEEMLELCLKDYME
eukprot:2420049-Amphidinium_carterae.1